MARRGGSAWLTQHYGTKCKPQTVSIMLNSGVARTFDARTSMAWKAFAEVLRAYGYHVRSADTGTYNCRNTASGYPSPHSWATAIDLNWQTNPATGGPYGGRNVVITDMPMEMVAAIKGIKTVGGVPVLGWGGDYTSFKDAMHFEIIATPAEIAKGIDWDTVRIAQRDPADPATWPTLEFGDKGPSVKELQVRLIEAGFTVGATGADGGFGAETQSAVRAYQSSRGISVDGMVGLQTWTALLNRMPALEPNDAGPVKDDPLTPDYAVAVRYGRGAAPDERVARMLAAALHLNVEPASSQSTVGTVYLVGGPAVREFDRTLATEVIELAGATRQETLDRVHAIVSAFITDL